MTYFTFFALGFLCYASAPTLATLGMLAVFAAAFCIIASMYGGGFATVPAYLADMFGTQFVGAIHGRLLTAWSTAGIVGPVIVNYMHDQRAAEGVPRGGDLPPDLLCPCRDARGWLHRQPLHPALGQKVVHEGRGGSGPAGEGQDAGAGGTASPTQSAGLDMRAVLAWAAVGIPLAWGIWITLEKSLVLFR